mmetsp:Transcript_20817/g.63341  ORF Transcript_20817/g.63341 Transcript_20817/m.63341 type:complete len:224 (-) Transcript_20817:1470-2141(-)
MPGLLSLPVAAEHRAVLQELAGPAKPNAIRTTETLLSLNTGALCAANTPLDRAAVDAAKGAVARLGQGPSWSGWDFARRERTVRVFGTGCRALDAGLGGGARSGTLLEIVGPSGCGKSQLCLTAAIRAALLGEEVRIHAKTARSACAPGQRALTTVTTLRSSSSTAPTPPRAATWVASAWQSSNKTPSCTEMPCAQRRCLVARRQRDRAWSTSSRRPCSTCAS